MSEYSYNHDNYTCTLLQKFTVYLHDIVHACSAWFYSNDRAHAIMCMHSFFSIKVIQTFVNA